MDITLESFKRLPLSTILAARRYGINNISAPANAPAGKKLCMAIVREDNREVQDFLNSGVDINFQDEPDGWTPLIYSIYYGNRKARALLLANGADVNAADYANRTALMFAAVRGEPELIEELLDRGAETDILDLRGKNALDFAIEYHRQNCIGLLQAVKK